MIQILEALEWLKLQKTLPVIDVRSPGEYAAGHIPGAVNLPLFDDEERKRVGIIYKNSGREAATFEGLGFVKIKLQDYVKQARRIAPGRKAMLHCWRGGMRSESMAWLLSLAGFDIFLLKDGYKAYRKYIRESWNKPLSLIVISGKTGSGKTEILQVIRQKGYQVLDLERNAHHKGSAFGAIGEDPQPTNEQFENNLANQWLNFDDQLPVFTEDESRFIGAVNIPEPLYVKMQSALTVNIELSRSLRTVRLIKDYASFPKETLIESILKIDRRLGGQHVKTAIEAIENKDFETAIEIVLYYYDKTYAYDLQRKASNNITTIETHTIDAIKNTEKILEILAEMEMIKK
ncbi:MAG: tRNA 2-selenouridine(34) synthase MnmH [Bacteroidales bacterium]|nr:tRNA 2-selenouridine(34) synthase MnmH [Bacteroidales bacterium]